MKQICFVCGARAIARLSSGRRHSPLCRDLRASQCRKHGCGGAYRLTPDPVHLILVLDRAEALGRALSSPASGAHAHRGADRRPLHLRHSRLAQEARANSPFRLDMGADDFRPFRERGPADRRSRPDHRRRSGDPPHCGRWEAAPRSRSAAGACRRRRRIASPASGRPRSCSCTGRAPAFPRRRCVGPPTRGRRLS